mmetsp:Transcript_130136/g.417604  ORF Transcript_130136/g.417604 Transcript_130136/m.417604 type:complete len:293 (+) Transcript_130136:415-1293(+)
MLAQNVVEVRIQLHVVLVQVLEETICAQHARDLHELVVVVAALEERLLTEDHACEHAAETPNVQGVVVQLKVHKEFGPLVVARCNPDVVLLARMVELSQTPIDEPQLSLLMIDHHIVRLHISVHDALGVAVIQSFQDLEDVVSDVQVGQRRVQSLEVGVVHMLEDQTGRLRLRVPDRVKQLDDVGAAAQVLQDPDLALDFLLHNRLQNLDHTLLSCGRIDALEHLTVLSSANFPRDLVVVLATPIHREDLVVPIIPGSVRVYVGVQPRQLLLGRRSRRHGVQGRRAPLGPSL